MRCFLKHAGHVHFMCHVHSGVIQGCPLGATLFVIAVEPFVHMFHTKVEQVGLGIVRLCADDVAIVLKTWHSLSIIYIRFLSMLSCVLH